MFESKYDMLTVYVSFSLNNLITNFIILDQKFVTTGNLTKGKKFTTGNFFFTK